MTALLSTQPGSEHYIALFCKKCSERVAIGNEIYRLNRSSKNNTMYAWLTTKPELAHNILLGNVHENPFKANEMLQQRGETAVCRAALCAFCKTQIGISLKNYFCTRNPNQPLYFRLLLKKLNYKVCYQILHIITLVLFSLAVGMP